MSLFMDIFLVLGAVFISGFIAQLFAKNAGKLMQLAVFLVCMGLFNGVIFPDFIRPAIEGDRIEEGLLGEPFYQALKEKEPATFEQWVEQLKDAKKQGLSMEQAGSVLQRNIEDLMMKRLPYASDDAVYGFVEAFAPAIKELRLKSGDLCYGFLFPENGQQGSGASAYLSESTQRRSLDAMQKIILESGTGIAAPAADMVMPDLIEIMQSLEKKYGAEVMMAMENPAMSRAPKEEVCDMVYSMYRKILALEKQKAIDLLRVMFSNSL